MNENRHITIKNIYYMLSYAYHSLREQDAVDIETEEFAHVYDLFAAILVKGISNLLRKGLYSEYREESDELRMLRGRVNVSDSIKRRSVLKRRMICSYDDFSIDCCINQILKSVAMELITSPEVKEENKKALKRLMYSFVNVRRLQLSGIRWDKVIIHRNNATYFMLINICCLAVKRMVLSTTAGDVRMPSFLDDQEMHRLYEKFILAYYKKWYSEYKPVSKRISWNVEGTSKYLPYMQTDIMLTGNEKSLIIDAKYYSKVMLNRYGQEKFHSDNLYQIYAYVKNQDRTHSGNVSGLLLYAKTEKGPDVEMNYNMDGNHISVRTLDLNVTFKQIKEQLNSIVEQLAAE